MSLIKIHLLESPLSGQEEVEYIGSREVVIDTISWSLGTVWINRSRTAGFKGVVENVWEANVGGFKVARYWFKYRKGKTLSNDDIEHYQKVVVALSETIRLMAEIDRVIDEHGGWPGAFVTEKLDAETEYAEPQLAREEAAEKPKRTGGPYEGKASTDAAEKAAAGGGLFSEDEMFARGFGAGGDESKADKGKKAK